MSSLVSTSAPAGEPVTLAEAKAWLRVDSSDDDVLITALIEAARTHVETFTRRALVTQSFELSLDAFPGCGTTLRLLLANPRYLEQRGGLGLQSGREIELSRPPLISVESVKYYDTDGVLQTLSTAAYYVDIRSQPGRVVLNDNYDWPDTQVRPNAVIVAYTAGYGTSSQVPQGLRTAIRYLLSNWYENRGPVETGLRAAAVEVPMTVEALMWMYRIPGAY